MKNKTTNVFRFKIKKPRQTCIQLDTHNESEKSQEGDDEINIKRGFSSQYINLAKRFNIKIIGDHSLSKIKRNQRFSSCLDIKPEVLRLKTQVTRPKMRYKLQSPLNYLQNLQMKPNSFWVNQKSTQRSSRSNRQALLRLNKNTIYNDKFFKLRTEQDNSLIIQQELVKLTLNEGDEMLVYLGNHCRKLLSIKQSLQKKSVSQNEIIREIKLYVLREQGYSISKLDKYFGQQKLKKQIKQLVIIERIVLISIICNVVTQHLNEMIEESNRSIQIILGYWYQIINNTYSQNIYKLQIQQDSQIKQILQVLSQAKLLTKSNTKLLLETLIQKIPLLFKHFKPFYNKISFLINLCKDLSINRAFYEVLTLFAGFLTQFQNKNKINLDNVSFFATCPSPYLVKATTKPYSLVVDLDQTLLYFDFNPKNKQIKNTQILYRPGCFQFIEQLSEYYQIIIFTTSLESYAREATKDFKGIDNYLFRQHAVRVKTGFVKDLSRLGRDLNKIIILDDLSSNFKWQKDNGIKIKSWMGDMNDNELNSIKQALIKIAKGNSVDVKTDLNSYREEISKKTTIIPLSTQTKKS